MISSQALPGGNTWKVVFSNLIISCGNSSPMILISFLTVSLDEMNYGVRHIKLFKIQNQPFAGVLQDSAKFTEIHLCRSLFYNHVASELWQKFYEQFFLKNRYGRLLLKMKNFLSFKIFNKGNIDFQ